MFKQAIKVAKGTFTQAGQFQVIIGNTVSDFYNGFVAVALGRMPWDSCEKVLGNYEGSASILRPYEAAAIH